MKEELIRKVEEFIKESWRGKTLYREDITEKTLLRFEPEKNCDLIICLIQEIEGKIYIQINSLIDYFGVEDYSITLFNFVSSLSLKNICIQKTPFRKPELKTAREVIFG